MSKTENSDVVPAHGYTVDNTKQYMPEKSEAPAPAAEAPAPAAETPAPAASTATEESAAPAAEEAAAAPAEEKKTGGNDDLLASMSAQLQQLTAQLNSAPAGAENAQPGQDPMVQLDEQLMALQQQAEKGEITYEEMIVQTAPIIEQRATINVQRQMEAQAQQRQVQDAQGQFLAQYPDFPAFAQSPEAQAMVQQNPVFDPVSAYFATREQKMVQEAQGLQAKIAELEGQIQKSIKSATTEQGKVVGGEGAESVGVPTTYRGDGLDPRKGGLNALQRARSTAN